MIETTRQQTLKSQHNREASVPAEIPPRPPQKTVPCVLRINEVGNFETRYPWMRDEVLSSADGLACGLIGKRGRRCTKEAIDAEMKEMECGELLFTISLESLEFLVKEFQRS